MLQKCTSFTDHVIVAVDVLGSEILVIKSTLEYHQWKV